MPPSQQHYKSASLLREGLGPVSGFTERVVPWAKCKRVGLDDPLALIPRFENFVIYKGRLEPGGPHDHLQKTVRVSVGTEGIEAETIITQQRLNRSGAPSLEV
jgi:hypothetical protein